MYFIVFFGISNGRSLCAKSAVLRHLPAHNTPFRLRYLDRNIMHGYILYTFGFVCLGFAEFDEGQQHTHTTLVFAKANCDAFRTLCRRIRVRTGFVNEHTVGGVPKKILLAFLEKDNFRNDCFKQKINVFKCSAVCSVK